MPWVVRKGVGYSSLFDAGSHFHDAVHNPQSPHTVPKRLVPVLFFFFFPFLLPLLPPLCPANGVPGLAEAKLLAQSKLIEALAPTSVQLERGLGGSVCVRVETDCLEFGEKY